IENHNVDITIVIEIVEGGPAGASFDERPITSFVGDVDELRAASVPQNDARTFIGCGVVEKMHIVVEVTTSDEEIAVAIIVEVHNTDAPLNITKATLTR